MSWLVQAVSVSGCPPGPQTVPSWDTSPVCRIVFSPLVKENTDVQIPSQMGNLLVLTFY